MRVALFDSGNELGERSIFGMAQPAIAIRRDCIKNANVLPLSFEICAHSVHRLRQAASRARAAGDFLGLLKELQKAFNTAQMSILESRLEPDELEAWLHDVVRVWCQSGMGDPMLILRGELWWLGVHLKWSDPGDRLLPGGLTLTTRARKPGSN